MGLCLYILNVIEMRVGNGFTFSKLNQKFKPPNKMIKESHFKECGCKRFLINKNHKFDFFVLKN